MGRELAMQEFNRTAGLGQQTEHLPGSAPGPDSERRRVEAVVETLATLRSEGESLAELAHDARNMVTALGLYCDLLEEPGVLATQFTHYANELRLVAAASRRLVEKLVALDVHGTTFRGTAMGLGRATRPAANLQADAIAARTMNAAHIEDTPKAATGATAAGRWDLMPPALISNLAQELLLSRNLLSALAGPSIALSVDVEGGALPVRLNAEDLTRVLVNLVKNSAEAMPAGGSIRIALRKRDSAAQAPITSGAEAVTETGPESRPKARLETEPEAKQGEGGQAASTLLSLTIEDSGPGIPRKALERIFEAGFTTRGAAAAVDGGWPSAHRGLGLSITRSIVEAAGGHIYVTNREGSGTPNRGARFEILLPVRCR